MKRVFACLLLVLGLTAAAPAATVLVPDNGMGTGHMPALAAYNSIQDWQVINGLPFGSTLDIQATLQAPLLSIEGPGGLLGGTTGNGSGLNLTFNMQGTGAFLGFNRVINLPVFTLVVDSAPRMLASPLQLFNTTAAMGQAQIFSDPDFDLLRVTFGDSFGLPSPGLTQFAQVGPLWNIYSYFDVTYRIDFVGAPGGTFGGMSGSTTGISRIEVGMRVIPEPASFGLAACMLGTMAIRRRRAGRILNDVTPKV